MSDNYSNNSPVYENPLIKQSNQLMREVFEPIYTFDTTQKIIDNRKKKRNDEVAAFLEQYKNDSRKVLFNFAAYRMPSSIKDETEVVLNESMNLFVKDEAICPSLDCVVKYLRIVKPHLLSIKRIQGSKDPIYLRVSSTIAEMSLLTIITALNIQESDFNCYYYVFPELNFLLNNRLKEEKIKKLYKNAFDLIYEISRFDLEDYYKQERFNSCKKDVLRCVNRHYKFSNMQDTYNIAKDVAKDIVHETKELASDTVEHLGNIASKLFSLIK